MNTAEILDGQAPATGLHLASSSRRIPQLDGLRGIAILLVVLLHYTMFSVHESKYIWLNKLMRICGFGWSGVDLFFVLSGFLIGGILLEAKNSESYFRTFYVRRVCRIFPLYYAWLLVFVVVLVAGILLGRSPEIFAARDLFRFSRYLFFLQNFFANMTLLERIWLSPAWSLAVEEQYYLIAPLLIRFLSTRKLAKVLLATVVIAPVLRFVVSVTFGDSSNLFATIWMPCRADNLALGMLGAIAVRSTSFEEFLRKRPWFLIGAAIVLGTAVLLMMPLYFRPGDRFALTVGLSVLALFWLAVLLLIFYQPRNFVTKVCQWQFLQRAGTLSYCVYLIHSTVNVYVHAFFRLELPPMMLDWRGFLATVVAAVLVWGIAEFSWRYFEKPLLRRGHRYSY
jgi:peptidoglycan/LPS O-acetylase OafA/YrhL